MAVIGGGVGAVVHEGAIDPDLDRPPDGLDDHAVPFPHGLLRAIGQVHDAARLSLRDPPLLLWPPPLLHVRHRDVLDDAPEVARVLAVHLYLDGLREHLVQCARRRRVDQDTSVPWLGREAVFHFESVVAKHRIADQVPVRFSEAHQQAVADQEWVSGACTGVHGRDVNMPSGKVPAIEEGVRLSWFESARSS